MDSSFLEALASDQIEHVRLFPKADLHCHSVFSARLGAIEEWANVSLPKPPVRMLGLAEMNDFARRYLEPHTGNRSGYEFVCETAVVEAIQDGVVLLEMSFDVSFVRLYGMELDPMLEFLNGLTHKYREIIDIRPEIGVSRDRDPGTQIPLALACAESKLFKSIDLYGTELLRPPGVYTQLYERAKKHGLKLKAHAGEFGDADLVEETMHALDLDEIQHGIAAATSKRLMKELEKNRIRLNVCPTSNFRLSVASDLRTHPIKVLVENGVRVSINTDDLTFFGSSVSEEYLALYRAGTLSGSQLEKIRVDSLESWPG